MRSSRFGTLGGKGGKRGERWRGRLLEFVRTDGRAGAMERAQGGNWMWGTSSDLGT